MSLFDDEEKMREDIWADAVIAIRKHASVRNLHDRSSLSKLGQIMSAPIVRKVDYNYELKIALERSGLRLPQ